MTQNSKPHSLLFFGLLVIFPIENCVAAPEGWNSLFLYRGHNFDDLSLRVTQPNPDLNASNFDNRVHSIDYNGIWLFYEHTNYNTDIAGLVIWRNGTAQEWLKNEEIGGKVSSVRPAGVLQPNGWLTETVTFYIGNSFTGNLTTMIVGNTPELGFPNAMSLIIVGKGKSWTFYEEVDFNGSGHCLTTTEDVNFYADLNDLGFPLSATKSVEKGCWARHGVPLPPSKGIRILHKYFFI